MSDLESITLSFSFVIESFLISATIVIELALRFFRCSISRCNCRAISTFVSIIVGFKAILKSFSVVLEVPCLEQHKQLASSTSSSSTPIFVWISMMSARRSLSSLVISLGAHFLQISNAHHQRC